MGGTYFRTKPSLPHGFVRDLLKVATYQIRSLTVFDVVMVKRGEKECEQGRLTPRFGTTVIFGQVIT